MKSTAALCLAFLVVCTTYQAIAQSPPARLIPEKVNVDGKEISASSDRGLNLGPLPSNTVFQFHPSPVSELPDLRIRYKLDGYDTNWHDGGCYMFLEARFFNEAGDEVGQQDFKVTGESKGWKGSLADSAPVHRHETVTVPPQATRMLVVISSGGPPATIGVYAVASLTVANITSNSAPVALIKFPADHGLSSGTNATGWIRDGNVPSMAKIVTIGHSPPQEALAILDNNPTSHAEWHNILTSATTVAPGDHLILEWDEMFSMGVADLHAGSYRNLPKGHYIFRAAEFDMFGKPTGTEYAVPVVVSPPLWQAPWFWPICAFLAAAMMMGNWRYIAWRRVRNEMLRLKSQEALEKERLRIAQDIHDDLGARVTEISLASALAKKNAGSLDAANEDFDRISDMSRELVSSLYETVWAVNPENDNLDSLGTFLCQITNNLCKQTNLRCRLEMDELPRNVQVSSHVRHNIAKVVKEAVHNAVKHAHASEISLSLTFQKPELIICVKDNGIGFKIEENAAAGNGLRDIERRMDNVGGRCQIESHAGQGTSIRIQLNL